jgi:hypothetical protein
VEEDGRTKVYIYNLRGKRVWQAENYARVNAENIVFWDGRTTSGRLASNGMYLLIVTDEKNKIISKGRLALYDD